MQGVPKFKNSALDLTTPVCGYFVMCQIRLAKIYSCTKLDVSSFIHSRYMEQGLKFKTWALDPDHVLLGYFVTDKMGLA